MWRAPRVHEIEAPPEYKKLINASIFYNHQGNLRNASTSTIIQYVVALVIAIFAINSLLLLMLGLVSDISSSNILGILVILLVSLLGGAIFVYWGWYDYEEAWYHFDDNDRIFQVITRSGGNWEVFEVPYDAVDRVEFSGGDNGYAKIHAGGFVFNTSRMDSQRFSSVTELWDHLAAFDTFMQNWPIILRCPSCDREFGHHIGTAQCPFDEMILIDPEVKGRIDPENIHPDDRERV